MCAALPLIKQLMLYSTCFRGYAPRVRLPFPKCTFVRSRCASRIYLRWFRMIEPLKFQHQMFSRNFERYLSRSKFKRQRPRGVAKWKKDSVCGETRRYRICHRNMMMTIPDRNSKKRKSSSIERGEYLNNWNARQCQLQCKIEFFRWNGESIIIRDREIKDILLHLIRMPPFEDIRID